MFWILLSGSCFLLGFGLAKILKKISVKKTQQTEEINLALLELAGLLSKPNMTEEDLKRMKELSEKMNMRLDGLDQPWIS